MNDFILKVIKYIGIAVGTYIYIKKVHFDPLKRNISKKQLYKVYLPLFAFIEPYLYKEIPIDKLIEFINIFNKIKAKHYELIDSNLLNVIQILEKSIENNSYDYKEYEYVCITLDRLFEKTRKYLKLPTRNIFYKINNRQLSKSSRSIVRVTLDLLKELFIVFFLAAILYSIHLIFNNYF